MKPSSSSSYYSESGKTAMSDVFCGCGRRMNRARAPASRIVNTACVAVRSLFVLAFATACGGLDSAAAVSESSVREPVIYGEDGREEAYEAPDVALAQRVRSAVVALIRDQDLELRGVTPDVIWSAPNLMLRRGVCASERFADQPSVATCTGILVEPDLVLTAGHCARSLNCAELSLVFDFFYESEGSPRTIEAADVHRCREIVDYRVPTLAEGLDYGWIRLDRAASDDRAPLEVERRAFSTRLGEPLQMFDFGAGLPLKTQRGGSVVDPRAEALDYFVSDLDAFGGSSGAPVLDAGGRVLGILASGRADFEISDDGCLLASRLDPGVAAERVTYAFRAWEGLSQTDLPAPNVAVNPSPTSNPSCAVTAPGASAPSSLGIALLGILSFGVRLASRVIEFSAGARRWPALRDAASRAPASTTARARSARAASAVKPATAFFEPTAAAALLILTHPGNEWLAHRLCVGYRALGGRSQPAMAAPRVPGAQTGGRSAGGVADVQPRCLPAGGRRTELPGHGGSADFRRPAD